MKKRNIHSITSVLLVMLMLIGTLSSFTTLDSESAKPSAADATMPPSKTVLRTLYDALLELDLTQFVPSTTEALRTAMETAQSVLGDDEATLDMIIEVTQALSDAGNVMVFTVHQEVITQVGEIQDRDLTIYTADSVRALERALGNIEQLQNDWENGVAVSQARWDSALEELELALSQKLRAFWTSWMPFIKPLSSLM